MSQDQNRQPKGSGAAAGEWAPGKRPRPAARPLGGEAPPDGGLSGAEPSRVDERIAEVYGRYYKALDAAERAAERARRLRAAASARSGSGGRDIADAEARAAEAYAAARAVRAGAAPYEAEFSRRGGWTRAYLAVTNSNGHVHSSMGCPTCNNGERETRFAWLTEASGQDEGRIVEDAGEKACTVCYPSAPSLPGFARPSRYRSDGEIAREARAAEKEALRSAKDAAALRDPATGAVLFKTDRGATNAAAAHLSSLCWYGPGHPSAPEWLAETERIYAALEAKGSVPSAGGAYAEALARARKKHAKDARDGHAEAVRRGWASGEADTAPKF